MRSTDRRQVDDGIERLELAGAGVDVGLPAAAQVLDGDEIVPLQQRVGLGRCFRHQLGGEEIAEDEEALFVIEVALLGRRGRGESRVSSMMNSG